MNVDPFTAALHRCFPDAKLPEFVPYVLANFFQAIGPLNVGNQREQEKHLAEVIHHLNAASAAYYQLHPDVVAKLDRQFEENMRNSPVYKLNPTLVVGGIERHLIESFEIVLMAALYGLTGKFVHPRYPDMETGEEQPSALEAARKCAGELVPLTGKSVAEATWEKVDLVRHAILCWQQVAHAEPDLGSARFLDLLQGLADLFDPEHQRNWDAGDLVRTYRRSMKKLESEDREHQDHK